MTMLRALRPLATATCLLAHAGWRVAGMVVLLLPAAATAQKSPVEVRVEYIAGQNVYLNAGSSSGLAAGDTLRVWRGEALVGLFCVVSSTATRAVVAFAGAPFAVTRGETLRVDAAPAPLQAPPTPLQAPPAEVPARPSLLAAPRVAPPPHTGRAPVAVTGRVFAEMNALYSATQAGAFSAARTFATPAVGVRARVTHLPGDAIAAVHLRTSYRYSTRGLVAPAALVRVYQASLTQAFDALHLTAGRFYDPVQATGGYWDGVLARYGTDAGLSVGAAAGLEPARADAGFSADRPKYAAFAGYGWQGGRASYQASASLTTVQPRTRWPVQTTAGVAQRVAWRGFRLDADGTLDRDPQGGRWVLSLLQARAAMPLGAAWRAHARYGLRRPFAFWRTDALFPYRSDQYGGGLSYTPRPFALGADVTWNRLSGAGLSRTLSGYLSVPRLGLAGLGLDASGSLWRRDGLRTAYVTGGLARAFGRLQARAAYALYRTRTGAPVRRTHALQASLDAPLARRLFASVTARTQFGSGLTSTSMYTGLWMSF